MNKSCHSRRLLAGIHFALLEDSQCLEELKTAIL